MSVGQPVIRKDSLEKVRGEALYVDDHAPEGCWFGATVRSTVPHGRIRSIRFPEHIRWDELVVVTAADIPGRNLVALIFEDQPLLADGYVRHVAEPILLIAGPNREQVREAAAAVQIDYERLPAVVDLKSAREQGSAPGCEVSKPIRIQRGDLEAGFAEADLIVEGEYWVPHQEQLYIEPNGFIAWWEPDGTLVTQGSHQCPYYVHKAMKALFELRDEQVRVICTTTGGGFGGKEDFPSVIAGHAALLAKKAGRPVKLIYGRGEDFACTTKRHPARMYYRTGVKKDGTLTACYAEVDIDCGAYVTLSPVVLSRGSIHASGPYYYPAIEVRGTAYATHTPPNGAFRGFGAPQVYFGIERHIDRIAHAIGMDPVALREKNLLKPGMLTATGQLLKESVSAARVLEEAVARSDYHARAGRRETAPDLKHRGVGVSLYMHGNGFTGSGEARMKSLVGMHLLPEGKVEILTASTDIGQGTATVFAQIAAGKLGLGYDQIFVAPPDTARVPDSGPTVASRTVTIVGSVVAKLAEHLRDRILEYAARSFGGRPADYRLEDHWLLREHPAERVCSVAELASRMVAEEGAVALEEGYHLNPSIQWDEVHYRGDAYPAFSWGCVVTGVAIDPDTLEVEIEHLTAVHDIGTVIHPVLAAGQVEGGLVQALGYGLMEEVLWRDGTMLNHNLANYIIPTALDVPELEVSFIENPFADGPFGAKGLGEIPMNGVAPALANAIANALRIEVNTLPVTPERILVALKKARAAGGGQ